MGPLWSPPKADRNSLKFKSSWHRRRRSKKFFLAVNLKHYKRRREGGRGSKGREGGGGSGEVPPLLLRCTAVLIHHCLHDLRRALPAKAVPIRNYLPILTQFGAGTALHIKLPRRPAGGPNLIHTESSDDGILLAPPDQQVGNPQHARYHMGPCKYHDDPSFGGVPPGYNPTTIAGIQCYSNMQNPEGMSLYTPMAALGRLKSRVALPRDPKRCSTGLHTSYAYPRIHRPMTVFCWILMQTERLCPGRHDVAISSLRQNRILFLSCP